MEKFQIFNPNRFVFREGEPAGLPGGATDTAVSDRRDRGDAELADLDTHKPKEFPVGSVEHINQLKGLIHMNATVAEKPGRQGTPEANTNGLTDAQVWAQHLELLWASYNTRLTTLIGDPAKERAVSEELLAYMDGMMARFETYVGKEVDSADKTAQLEFIEKKRVSLFFHRINKFMKDISAKNVEVGPILSKFHANGDNASAVGAALMNMVIKVGEIIDQYKKLKPEFILENLKDGTGTRLSVPIEIIKGYLDWFKAAFELKKAAMPPADVASISKQIEDAKLILDAAKKYVEENIKKKS